MVNIESLKRIATTGELILLIQSAPKWFNPANLRKVAEFEMALVDACLRTEMRLIRFIPYAPSLLEPKPDPSYFAELFDKIEVSSVTGAGFESWRLNGTAADFKVHENRLGVELIPDADIAFNVCCDDPIVDELRNSSTPMNTVGFSRMDSFFFDHYHKVDFDE